MAESKNDRHDDEVDDKEAKDAAPESEPAADEAKAADSESESSSEEEKKSEPVKKSEPAGKMTVPQSPKAKAAAPAAAAAKKEPEPGLMTPTNIALLLAAGGLLAFWKGWALYSSEGRDYYSGSAWLFVIAFFAVTVSAFHFIGGQLPKQGAKVQRLENKLGDFLPALPFFALYAVIWWVAWDTWKVMYGPGHSWMWMFFIGIAACSWGVWHAMKPPSVKELERDELPTRRVLLLLMIPFVAVFGMIWLAEKVAGH